MPARHLIRSMVLSASLLAASPSAAVLVDQGDWSLDTNTNLEWLNLQVSQVDPSVDPLDLDEFGNLYEAGFSYDAIAAGAGGFAAAGWRHATTAEVCGLLGTYGGVTTCGGTDFLTDPESADLAALMEDHLGIT